MRRFRLRRWLIVACLAVAPSGFAATPYEIVKGPEPGVAPGFRWSAYRRFSSSDGLPGSTVRAFAQDKQGFVYAATENGVARFDGRAWHKLALPVAQRNSVVLTLTSTNDGAIWIGTDDSGLFRYLPGAPVSRVALPSGATENDIEALIPATTNSAYVGTSQSLYRCDEKRCEEIPAGRGLQVAALLLGEWQGEHCLWVGTNVDGLYRIDGIDRPNPRRANWQLGTAELGAPTVRALAQWGGNDGKDLWIGTGSALARLSSKHIVLYAATSSVRNGVSSLIVGRNQQGVDVLRVGLYTQGVGEINLDGTWTITNRSDGLPDDHVLSLFQTDTDLRSPVAWIGLQNGGVARRDAATWSAFDERNGLPSHLVETLGQLDMPGGLATPWIGTAAGAVRWHDQRWQPWLPEELQHSEIHALVQSGDRLWLGTNDGLVSVQGNVARTLEPPDSERLGIIVQNMLAQRDSDDEKTLWFGTHHALGRLKHDRIQREPVSVFRAESPVDVIFETKSADQSIIWVGGAEGLAYRQDGIWHAPPTECIDAFKPIMDLRVESAAADAHFLWIAHRDGVTRLNLATLACEAVPQSLLASESAVQLQFDKSHCLYVFGKHGIARLAPDANDPDNLDKYTVTNFGRDDGLPTLEFNRGSMVDSEGRIWAATGEGAVIYDPREEQSVPTPRPLRLLSARVDGLDTPLESGAVLEADQNDVTFEFTLLSNQRDRRTRYRTELAGLDQSDSGWTAEGQRTYSRLPAGDYTFRVFARDGFGVEAVPLATRFSIRLPLWLRWWALVGYALMIVAVAVTLSRWRIDRIRRASKILEKTVEERTASLTVANAQLDEARKAAEAATQSKSTFLANMSHEIRTPMNAVLGFAGLGLRLNVSTKAHDYFRKINNAGQNLLNILNDILDFSKIEAGKMALETVPFTLSDVLAQVTDLFALKASEKNLEFVVGTAPDVSDDFVGDPLRLGQVLINLVNNAIKFTRAGFVQLYVEQSRRSGSKAILQFSVEDSGIGMSAEQVARLFQPFSQADNSTTRNFGGTGLGLTISQRLVAQMGGTISVVSHPGAGTCFRFEIALRLAESERAPHRIAPEDLVGLRILVVDDSEQARLWLVDQLTSLRFDVRCVESGEAALQVLRREPFDLIMMDWMMPGIDGIETTRRIREDLCLAKIPEVIMVTAYGREAIREAAEAIGVGRFLIKPVNPSVLLDTIVETVGADAMKASHTPDIATSDVHLEHHPLRVLLAEDNLVNQQLAIEMLAAVGISADVANNGTEALRMSGAATYEAILMDIQMPEMDGYMTTRAIRQRMGSAAPPIIAMTAHASEDYRRKCLDAGTSDFIAKPIIFDELMSTLKKWTRKLSIEAPRAASEPALELDGIDVDSALSRMRGNIALFQKLIALFSHVHGASEAELHHALSNRDFATASRVVHGIAGAAGNIGATRLHALARELEDALENGGDAALDSHLEPFGTELRKVLQACAKMPVR